MRGRFWAGFAVLVVFGTPMEASTQPVFTLDLAAASGGDTNDVQLAYGGGVEFWRAGRLAAGADFLYVRDFFEFEPDAPLDDAQIYTDVLGAFAVARFALGGGSGAAVSPYLLAGPGWLRSRALGREADHLGLNVGGGLGLWTDRRVGLRLETRYVTALTGSGDDPPEQRLSFWRTGVSVTFAVGERTGRHDP
jgi:hypothetical protein